MTWEMLSVVLQIFCTLAVFSFLYKDNPIYKFTEHMFVGVATGWWIVLEYRDVIWPNLLTPLFAGYAGQSVAGAAPIVGWWRLHIPLLLGFLLLMRLVPKVSYLSRCSMAVIVGTFAGLAVRGFTAGDLFQQTRANIVPLVATGSWSAFFGGPSMRTLLELLRNPVLIVGTLTVLIYFFFSVPHKGAVGHVAKIGIWFLMVSFGASYGNTVMARISLFIGRAQFLLLEETKTANGTAVSHRTITLVLAVLIIATLAAWERFRPRDDDEPA